MKWLRWLMGLWRGKVTVSVELPLPTFSAPVPMKIKPPDGGKYPEGKSYLAWGKSWHSHFDDSDNWVAGQVLKDGEMKGQHDGKDRETPMDVPLGSPIQGPVTFAGEQPGYGNSVRIDFEHSVPNHLGLPCIPHVIVAHMSRIDVRVGQFVHAGEHIGLSGDSGNVTGPHVHVTMKQPDGRPMPFEWEEA